MNNLDKYRADLDRLLDVGEKMLQDLLSRFHPRGKGRPSSEKQSVSQQLNGSFERDYQRWYSEALSVVRQLLPSRLVEFESLYKGDGKRKEIILTTFSIQDWMLGVRSAPVRGTEEKVFDDSAAVSMRYLTQLDILKSVRARFDTSLYEIAALARADLFDSELDASRELLKNGFVRAAGVVAGVVLEKHLQQVFAANGLAMKKKHPTIGDLNDPLKEAGITDVPTWRQIQRLGDLRNLCSHSKDREPTRDEVAELIDGCSKISKTVH